MAALFSYMQRVQLLLKDENFEQFNDEDVIRFINMGRGQIAATTQCIRVLGTLAVTAASQVYAFSAITGLGTGVAGAMNVQQVTYSVASGKKFVHVRPWPYFNLFYLSQPAPTAGPPVAWAQYAQGSAGSLYVNVLDGAYTLNVDCTAYPSDLALDADTEAIPYSWQDSIPFFACYLLAMTAQNFDVAEKFWKEFQKFVEMARAGANPSIMPLSFNGSPDPFRDNRLGIQGRQ